ncbi:MAG: exodeoxyribonuclease VII small subunit [Synechococcaceae bacterium WB4_2_0805]|nr:exodeoxyribonuclease VII small subunit [Synechococcaceae bacterium WB4_2_0805]
MTNFQPDQASKGLSFITPERALLLLPVLAGIVLSGAVAGFALVPAANKLQELEKLIGDMESGKLSLEETLIAYQRGTELIKKCQVLLEQVEQQIRIFEAE